MPIKTKTSKKKPNRKIALLCAVLIVLAALGLHALSQKAASTPAHPVAPIKVDLHGPATAAPSKTAVSSKSSVSAQHTVRRVATAPASILAGKHYPQHEYYALQTVNDPLNSGSWYHSKLQTGRAWDVTTGSSSTVIAVIDTGVALNHQDLTNKWFTNSGEIGMTDASDPCWTGTPVSKSTNNCDDDGNGYIDDWRGWDFVNGDNSPQTGVTNANGEGVSHATAVSGIIAASANNSLGNAGIDWQAKIMPLQVLSDDGTGFTNNIASAIQYATDNGAKIINMSLGGGDFDQALLDAVTYANNHGVLVVAASGNCGNSTTGSCTGLPTGGMTYPARYGNVLAVGATDSSDAKAAFSSYGPELDVMAPGASIGPVAAWSSTLTTNGYSSSASGTSFSSPMVAGVAGLIRSELSSPTPAQLTSIILDSADKVGDLASSLRSDNYGFGRLNADKAVLLAKSLATPPGNVGTTEIQERQGPLGGITRSSTGSVQNDEWVLVSCRVDPGDVCSAAATNGGTTSRFNSLDTSKGAGVYNMFISGSSLTSGSSTISVQNKNYAVSVGTLSK